MGFLCISYPLNYLEVVNHLLKKVTIFVLFVRMEEICYAVKIVHEHSTMVRTFQHCTNCMVLCKCNETAVLWSLICYDMLISPTTRKTKICQSLYAVFVLVQLSFSISLPPGFWMIVFMLMFMLKDIHNLLLVTKPAILQCSIPSSHFLKLSWSLGYFCRMRWSPECSARNMVLQVLPEYVWKGKICREQCKCNRSW